MASAIADKQQWVADLAKAGHFEAIGKNAPWQDYADRLLDAVPKARSCAVGHSLGDTDQA